MSGRREGDIAMCDKKGKYQHNKADWYRTRTEGEWYMYAVRLAKVEPKCKLYGEHRVD